MTLIKGVLLIMLVFAKVAFSQNLKTPVLITNPGNYELIGELGYKLGRTVTIEAKIIEGPFKGYEGGPNALILSINDSVIQSTIKIPITPYFGSFGKGDLPEIQINDVYRFRVYETGKFVGVPRDAYQEANIILQTTGFYFKNELVVISGERIKEQTLSPDMFLGRNALLSGRAINIDDTAYIKGTDWKIKLTDSRPWEQYEIGKNAEVYGLINNSSDPNIYLCSESKATLVDLKDMLDHQVTLRGIALSMNGKWWFQYRGEDIYVENMNKLPDWSTENHFRSIEISGVLKTIEDKSIDQEKLDFHSYCSGKYVVVNPEWKEIDGLLNSEISTGR